jgi:DNA invertase Pin-like site-specific DNA recombinase
MAIIGDSRYFASVMPSASRRLIGPLRDRVRYAEEAVRRCRVHGAKLIIAKLDRLARNVRFVSSLMEAGVQVEAVDFPQANELTIHIKSAVAQHEAKAISQRTKAALAAAKARGTNLGGVRRNHKPFTAETGTLGPRTKTAHDNARAKGR